MNKVKTSLGVTLIELLIVIAIIALIAAIGIPAYSSKTEKARRADAKALLTSLVLAEERFYSVHGQYIGGSDTDVSSSGDSFKRLDLDLNKYDVDDKKILSEKRYYQIETLTNVSASNTTFTATAVPVAGGAQANDTSCSKITITHLGVKSALDKDGNDSTDVCW